MDFEPFKTGESNEPSGSATTSISQHTGGEDKSAKDAEGGRQHTLGSSASTHTATEFEDRPAGVRSVVDPQKGRFSNIYSGVLFPRRVGHAVGLSNRVRFQSYGWNLDIRLEPTPPPLPAIRRFLTYQDVARYGRIFFDVVDPVYHILKHNELLQRCAEYWTTDSDHVDDIEAVIAGIVALGSFFSECPISDESRLIEHAKTILDVGCTCAPGWTSLNQTAGWILRTLYLRLTTRPLLSWYASCSIVHIAEANGLHVDLQTVDLVSSTYSTPAYFVSRSALLDCGLFLNTFISAEYGRSRVTLRDVAEPGAESTSLLRTLHTILTQMETNMSPVKRLDLLSTLGSSSDEPCARALLKSDVAIHFYRMHMNSHQDSMSCEESKTLLSILQTGLASARILLSQRKPWWNVLSTPFQSLMVFLVMDSDKSLAMIEEAMAILAAIYEIYPTHLAGEVLHIARTLVKGLEERKLRQAQLLSKLSNTGQPDIQLYDYSGLSAADSQTPIVSEAILENWLTNDAFARGMSEMDVFQYPNAASNSFTIL